MSGNDLTTEAVRLAMSMNQLRAEYASQNIAKASTPGAQATRLDFGFSQGLLEQATQVSSSGDTGLLDALANASAQPQSGERLDAPGSTINLDEEVADMVSANLKFQTLTESLNRHFGLMRLAITGRN